MFNNFLGRFWQIDILVSFKEDKQKINIYYCFSTALSINTPIPPKRRINKKHQEFLVLGALYVIIGKFYLPACAALILIISSK